MKKEAIQLIGQEVKIVTASNKSLEGLKGRIVDETRNTLSIESGGKIRKVLKKEISLEIVQEIIRGEDLIGMLSERLKKRIK